MTDTAHEANLLDRVREVRYGGLTCWTDGARVMPSLSSYDPGGATGQVAFLSLVGPQASVRAVWARLKSFDPATAKKSRRGRTPTSDVRVANTPVLRYELCNPEGGWLYDAKAPIPNGPSRDWLHLVLYHSGAVPFGRAGKDHAGRPEADWLLIGDNLPVRLQRALSSRLPLPLSVEWSWLLWERAQTHIRLSRHKVPLLVEAPGFGMPVYSCSPVLDDWHDLIKKLAQSKELF